MSYLAWAEGLGKYELQQHALKTMQNVPSNLLLSHYSKYNIIKWRDVKRSYFYSAYEYEYIYIYIIIMLHSQHGSAWPSPTTPLYHSSLLGGPLCYILYQHWAVVYTVLLVVLLLLIHVKRSTGVYYPYFSSSILHIQFISLG